MLLQLQNADSVSSQILALRSLKNELIGHDQRKEAYIAEGIIPALGQVLSSRWPGTLDSEDLSLDDRAARKAEECDACLQATLIVGSLAQGGRQFQDADRGESSRLTAEQVAQRSSLRYLPATYFQSFYQYYRRRTVQNPFAFQSSDS